jgi:excisionase family DNA binding protein
MEQERIVITVKEAAEIAGVSGMTIRRAINRGQIPFYRISDQIRIPKDKFIHLLRDAEARPIMPMK